MKSKILALLFIISFAFMGDAQVRYRVGIQDYATIQDLRDDITIARPADKVFIKPNKAIYYFDATDTTTPDDGLNTIVQTAGNRRWKCINCFNFGIRPWVKEGNIEENSSTDVLQSDNIYHSSKVSVGTDQFRTDYIQNIEGSEYINGVQNSYFDYNRSNTFSSISVNPLTGNDSADPALRPSTPFASLAAAVNFINSSSLTGRNTIIITGTTVSTPLNTGSFDIFRGKAINISANGQFINITGNINNYGIMVLDYGTYNFIANNRIINFYTAGFYAYTPTFNLSPTNTTVHFLFRVGSSGVFNDCNINYTGNNTAFYASENNSSILLFSTIFNNGGFTGLMLCRGLFNTYSNNNTCVVTTGTWDSLSSQNIDVSNVTLWNDNRVYQGFSILPPSSNLTSNRVNISSGNLKFFNLPAFDNDASATIPIGTIYQTTATNTLGLPQGVIMIKQ